MSDKSLKPSIPAWQRGPPTEPKPTSPDIKDTKQAAGAEESTTDKQESKAVGESADITEEEESAPPSEGTSQLEMVEHFLADPEVMNAPLEKKRAFLASKAIPVETIEQVLQPESTTHFQTSDFEAFKQQQQQSAPIPPSPQRQQQQQPTGPPIITYPEFLVDAHKPPPLITPARILGAAYVAGGLTTLLYGASKYILNPMRDTLTEARHDLASHSQTKLDDFNDRLSKIVTKIPEPVVKKEDNVPTPDIDISEVESVTSDPTELYHRDMGTQTSPGASRRPSSEPNLINSADLPVAKGDATERQSTALSILTSHISELTSGLDKSETSNKERQESVNKLRHYLDTIMYSSAAGLSGAWGTSDEAIVGSGVGKGQQDDAIEGLKKEIRGVKGVLLSARRFPAAGAGRGAGGV